MQFINDTPAVRTMTIEFDPSTDTASADLIVCCVQSPSSRMIYFGKGQSKFGIYLYSCANCDYGLVCHGAENLAGPL